MARSRPDHRQQADQRLRQERKIEPAPVEAIRVRHPEAQPRAPQVSSSGSGRGAQRRRAPARQVFAAGPGDEIVGYVSLGRGITIHGPIARTWPISKSPERMIDVAWEGENEATFRVEIQIDAYDRTRLLEVFPHLLGRPGSTSSRPTSRPTRRWSGQPFRGGSRLPASSNNTSTGSATSKASSTPTA